MVMEKRRTYVSAEQICMRESESRLEIRCAYDDGLNHRIRVPAE
jgi:hypothetical protein